MTNMLGQRSLHFLLILLWALPFMLAGNPPVLIYKFLEQTLSRGCNFSLKCIASGSPTPTIKWKMDGLEPSTSERFMIGQYVTLNGDVISHFNVSSCSGEDSSEVSCIAKNKFGSVSHKARINIFGPIVVRNIKNQTAVAGKDFVMKCPVGGYPIDSIEWEYNQKYLPFNSRQSVSADGVLKLSNVQKSDGGNYSCTAKARDTASSNSFFLSVVVPPKVNYFRPETTVQENQRVLKYCEAVGDPPIKLQWLKDSAPIPDHDPDIIIQKIAVDIALVLVVTNAKRELSHSNFTCLAQNNAGEDSVTTTLFVQESPRITEFNFPAEVYEGTRVSVHCSITNYPEELRFKWLKNGVEIGRHMEPEVQILQIDKFSSILRIENASPKNSGNYSCLAMSSFNLQSSHMAQLVVLVPPKWKTEPTDIEALEGEPVYSLCEADAYPTAKIRWKKYSGGRSYVDIPVQSFPLQSLSSNIVSFPNGSLFIPKVSSLEGRHLSFICEAENSVGPGISKLINLKINAAVNISPMKNVTVKVGSSVVLPCEITGDPPIEVSWFRDMEDINSLQSLRYFIKTFNTSTGVTSELTVSSVRIEDELLPYTCTAKNLCNTTIRNEMEICRSDKKSSWIILLEPPEIPTDLTVVSKGSRSVHLQWKLKRRRFMQNYKIAVKYRADGESPWNTVAVLPPAEGGVPTNVYSEIITNLKSATTYFIFVVVQNIVGNSESQKLTIRTAEEPPDQIPKNIIINSITSSRVKITWDPIYFSNGEILGYHVGFKEYGSYEPYFFKSVHNNLHETIAFNLLPYTKYEFVVRAFNSAGFGHLSTPHYVTTLESTPLAPEGLSCFTFSSQQIKINWTPLTKERTRGLLKGYILFAQISENKNYDGNYDLITLNTTGSTVTLDNLSKYATYEIQIRGFTVRGEGELSSAIYCQTGEDIPGPPENIKAIRLHASILIYWTPPRVSNGKLIKYTVYLSHTEEIKINSPPNITTLEVKRAYNTIQLYVTASTSVGEGKNASLLISSDDNIGGGLITFGQIMYVFARSDVHLHCQTAVGNPIRTWFHMSKIIQETERKYTESEGSILHINSINLSDSGNYSCFQPSYAFDGLTYRNDRITYSLIVQDIPSPPRLEERSVSMHEISLHWSIRDIGNAQIIRGYFLHIKYGGEWAERKIPSPINSYTLHDLRCGTTYPIFITTFNNAGTSNPSQILNITTLGGKPILIVSPESLVHVNSTAIRVFLKDSFSDSGCPITSFKVMYKKKYNDYHWKSFAESIDGDKHSIYLMGESNSQYFVKILCLNEAGVTEVVVPVNTLESYEVTPQPSNNSNILEAFPNESLFSHIKVIGVVVGLCLVSIIGSTLVYFFLRKRFSRQRSDEADSFTYFKQNYQGTQPQQVYMTVKKPPGKSVEQLNIFPDESLPYASYELQHRFKASQLPTEVEVEPNAFYIYKRQENCCDSLVPNFEPNDQGDEDEYESIASDTDSPPKIRNAGCSLHKHKPYDIIQQKSSRCINHYVQSNPYNPRKSSQGSSFTYASKNSSPKDKPRITPHGFRQKPHGSCSSSSCRVLSDEHLEDDICQIKV